MKTSSMPISGDIPIQPVERPILCSPYEAPKLHWHYDRTTGEASKLAGRRPSRYWYKTKDDVAGQLTLELSEGQDDLHAVNQLREDVARWRDSNYEGATQVSKELLTHWASPERPRRLFFCQLEAVQTVIYLAEILKSNKRPRFSPQFPVADAKKLIDPSPNEDLFPLTRFGCKIPALADTLEDAFEYSIRQSVITHYHPLPVLCCCLQTWLIWQAFDNKHPAADFSDWLETWHTDWTEWVLRCHHPLVVRWLKEVKQGDALDIAMEQITEADWLFDFDPFKVNIAGQDGYCLLTLQIAVWAYCWSNIDRSKLDVVPPPQIPQAVRDGEVGSGLAWSVLVGHDADTYGAVAGPMIAAFMGGLPQGMTEKLEAPKKLREDFPEYPWDDD